MKKFYFFIAMIFIAMSSFSQQKENIQPKVSKASFFRLSSPLREMIKNAKNVTKKREEENRNELEYEPKFNGYPGPDPLSVFQRNIRSQVKEPANSLLSFDGINNIDGVAPPDTQGDVNDEYYMQCVNNHTAIYDRNGDEVVAPFPTSDFWQGTDFDDRNDGDAVILWDEDAERWLVTQFYVPDDGDQYLLIAVSKTDDPTGQYYQYGFKYDYMPDYPKWGIWPDAYYVGANAFDQENNYTYKGTYASAFERDKILAGDADARMVTFGPDANLWSVFPVDADVFPQLGTDCIFVSDDVDDTAGNDEVYLFNFHVDWNNTANSSFQQVATLSVADYGLFNGDTQVPQKDTNQELDLLHYRVMYRPYYRHFDDHESLCLVRTVNDNNVAAIRWYEFRDSGNGWEVYQQGTYNPGDGLWRWMPSIAMNERGDIAIGYSVSGDDYYPSIRVTGRFAGDPLGVMTVDETEVFTGYASQDPNRSMSRWGDYSMVSVDPDNVTFWFTTEYTEGDWDWKTKIIHFELPSQCDYPDNQASDFQANTQSETQIDLSWTRGDGDAVIVLAKQDEAVDANPADGSSYTADAQFGNGDEIGTGNYVVYVGDGTSVSVTGLSESTTYHFAVYEYNEADFCYLTPATTASSSTYGLATVETQAMVEVNTTDAQGQGEVVSENGSTVTERGLCWSTSPDPTTSDDHDSNGSGEGTYTVNLTGLTANTTYYVRAYAINSAGTSYGDNVTFTTDSGLPEVTTNSVSSISTDSAVAEGEVTDEGDSNVTERGICWSTSPDPTTSDAHDSNGTGTGTYTVDLTGLTANTTYYVRAYAVNSYGTSYGDNVSFTTLCGVIDTFPYTEGFEEGTLPDCWSNEHVTDTQDWTYEEGGYNDNPPNAHTGSFNALFYNGDSEANVTKLVTPPFDFSNASSATLKFWHVQVEWSGDQDELRIYYKTSSSADWVLLAEYVDEVEDWTERVFDLPDLSNEYYIAFEATGQYGYGVGVDDVEVSIVENNDLPVVTTGDVTNITVDSATAEGEVTDEGGSSVTERGICWSTSPDPTTSDAHDSNGTGTGTYTVDITGLTANTTYYVRAYAVNSEGTSYGDNVSFTTESNLPEVTTNSVSSITTDSAVAEGEVTSEGASSVTERGICWSTSPDPTTSDAHDSNGTGTGTYTVDLTGLTANTTYYVRAYAINSEGTSYGDNISFTTENDLPEVTTNSVSSITTDSAVAEGEVTDEGSSSVTERGICWSTSPDPTTSDAHDSNGTGTGTYTVDLTGLTANTTYYVRAYATNSSGTTYGDNKSFTTQDDSQVDCSAINEFPYLQNFDDWTTSNPGDTCTADDSVVLEECWENISGDDSDWDIYSGGTPTADTGPSDDLLGGGKYIYMEASGCTSKIASIVTPHFDFTNVANPYMNAYMSMYGSDMGSISLYYSTDGGTNWEDAGTISGDQGEGWFKVYADFASLSGESDVQFKFEAETGDGELSDIAIDNFIIKDYTPYCFSYGIGSRSSDNAITEVIFNTIDNETDGKRRGIGYADFSYLSTIVRPGQSYDLTVKVATEEDDTVYTKVWIDWNQDHDFDDPGEEYDLGTATDVTDADTSKSPLSILIPDDAKFGKTRIRVSTKADDYPTSCEEGLDGEVEEYSIVVAYHCDESATWTGTYWYDSKGNSVDESDLADKLLLIDEVFVTNGKSFEACGLSVPGLNALTINKSDYIKLSFDVYNEGRIIIENTGALVQTEDEAVVEGAGEYEMQIQSQQMNNYYDYAFWATPIESFTLGGIVPDAWGYYAFDPTIQNWVAKEPTTVMEKGVSYAISAPEDFTGGTIDVSFKQDDTKFNAGNIAVPLTVNGTGAQDDDDANLVGNPYPSPIDFDQLASDNTNIQGAYYIWTNCAGLDDDGQHQDSGFAVYSTGSGSTAACDGTGVTVDQYIASGQGFYVEANDSGDLVFKNSQRVVADNIFINADEDTDRAWLDFTNNAGFSQTLVGFFDNATDGLDRLYDAHMLDGSSLSLYSLSGNDKLVIQGLSSWDDNTREIPLGFNTVAGGSHTISLHQVEGILRQDVNIYLKDLYEDKIIDLKQNAYDFSADQGNYNDRFVLIFSRSTLKVDPVENLSQVNLLAQEGVFVILSDQKNITRVEVFDLSGKLIYTHLSQQEESRVDINLENVAHQVLIFKITLNNQKTVTIKSIR